MTNWKVGDRVQFLGGNGDNPDSGTVASVDDGEVWAIWDSDGESQYFHKNDPKFIKSYLPVSETTEQDAVALLLSLGYTLTKQQIWKA